MAFIEEPDLDVFLVDFGVPVTAGARSGLGILDTAGDIVADGAVLTIEYRLTCATALFGNLVYGDLVVVDGENYIVREVVSLDDGPFCDLMLMRDQ